MRYCLILFLMAGVSCGIPDFRSRSGLYAKLQENGEYDLEDPQQMYETVALPSLCSYRDSPPKGSI